MEETYLERIKKLKSAQKITNDKLSDMTGIPLGTLSKLLAGINDSPKLSNIVAISQALGCSLDWLISGVPENTHNYTLSDEEIALIEDYRLLDAYGRILTAAVIEKERDRAAQQKAAEALTLHEAVRGRGSRTANSLGRAPGRNARSRHTAYLTDMGDGATSAGVRIEAESGVPAGMGVAALLSESAATSYRYKPMAASSPLSTQENPSVPAYQTAVTQPPVGQLAAGPFTAGSAAVMRSVQEPAFPSDSVHLVPPDRRAGNLPAGLRRRQIPLYDLPVSAGVGEFLSDNTRTDITIPDSDRTSEADYALRISGDSMEPRYHSGDVLLIQTAESVEEGELGIFVLDGSGYFKKYGGDRLLSLNPHYAPILLKDFTEVSCCGRVVGKLKRK